ncbi:MAG TPA: hypothetical protein VHB79_10330 [Polyangiaceae bacterium]|nr:hypothetical protein [Polyangiaceae bacterium]
MAHPKRMTWREARNFRRWALAAIVAGFVAAVYFGRKYGVRDDTQTPPNRFTCYRPL